MRSHNSTGHKHDGTTAEGPVIALIGDAGEATPNNKVVIDTANNQIEFSIEVSNTSTEQLIIKDGVIEPTTDDDIDLGSSTKEFKDLYLDGTANIDSLVADTADINAGTIDNASVGASTPAAGAFTTLSSSSLATLSSVDINGGNIDGAVIGASTAAAGSFTTVSTTGQATLLQPTSTVVLLIMSSSATPHLLLSLALLLQPTLGLQELSLAT